MRVFSETLDSSGVNASITSVDDDKKLGLVANISSNEDDDTINQILGDFTIPWQRESNQFLLKFCLCILNGFETLIMEFKKHVLIIGSGPNAVKAAELETAFDAIVVINNAWRVRPDWSHLILSLIHI